VSSFVKSVVSFDAKATKVSSFLLKSVSFAVEAIKVLPSVKSIFSVAVEATKDFVHEEETLLRLHSLLLLSCIINGSFKSNY
jgi:hypothetical protein